MGQTIGEWYIAQGELKGQRESEIRERASFLLRTLNSRFPNRISPELAARVQTKDDPETLSRWLDSAFQADSWDSFRAAAGW